MLKEEAGEAGLDGYSNHSEGLSLPFRHRRDRPEWRAKQLKCPLAHFLYFVLTRFLYCLFGHNSRLSKYLAIDNPFANSCNSLGLVRVIRVERIGEVTFVSCT